MIIAGIFSIDIEKLLKFYTDPMLSIILFVGVIALPLLFFFGFRVKLFQDQIIYRHNLFFKRELKINDLSQILYQPTWRGVTSQTSKTKMRSLQIVQGLGGFGSKIYLANGAFREENLADLAKKLQQMNPLIELDEHTEALIRKHEKDKSLKKS